MKRTVHECDFCHIIIKSPVTHRWFEVRDIRSPDSSETYDACDMCGHGIMDLLHMFHLEKDVKCTQYAMRPTEPGLILFDFNQEMTALYVISAVAHKLRRRG